MVGCLAIFKRKVYKYFTSHWQWLIRHILQNKHPQQADVTPEGIIVDRLIKRKKKYKDFACYYIKHLLILFLRLVSKTA
jgi:hypothetical protein